MADPNIGMRRRRKRQQQRRHQHPMRTNDSTRGLVRLVRLVVAVVAVVVVVSRLPFNGGGACAFTSSYSSSIAARGKSYNVHESPSITALHGGYGIADSYSWNEDQFELEVRVTIPHDASASDLTFVCSSDRIDLRLGSRVLLDGKRRMRGKICVEGTYWSIDDDGDDGDGGGGGDGTGGDGKANRTVTVTIEKHFVPTSVSSRDGTITYDSSTIFDWGGVYVDDEIERMEVKVREYGVPEELDVREYASKLGVDIDNIDMSKVNKTMFGVGLRKDADAALEGLGESHEDVGVNRNDNDGGFRFDINQATLERLTKAGLAREVVRQADGSEYELGMTGDSANGTGGRAFSMLGKDVSYDELREAGIVSDDDGIRSDSMLAESDEIIDDEVEDNDIVASNSRVVEMQYETVDLENSDEVGIAENSHGVEDVGEGDASTKPRDPIDMLTVARLREVLRAQGLKSTGTKQVLRDRLRDHVKSLLQEK
ncbi:hypothetical protein ACHAXA_007590 [Cyclostephanos tholiformis]|uniref:SAP domain-containing protein n=1 Tax=Cyclostephanos tholiformis TaxID=382380 RepID=A0ABD3REJ3_9STRA